jgi:hypothetical protein
MQAEHHGDDPKQPALSRPRGRCVFFFSRQFRAYALLNYALYCAAYRFSAQKIDRAAQRIFRQRICAGGQDTDMEYIVIVNSERRGNVDMLLCGPPRGIDLHWDNEAKRTQICPRALGRSCSWCDKEQSPRAYHYAPCLLCELAEGKEVWKKAIVQLPFGFVAKGNVKLSPGRWIRVTSLKCDGIQPCWHIGKLANRPPETFDVFHALMRIKGVVIEGVARINGVPERKPTLSIYREETA